MPIINGQKVACGPCIRGHRSTKCTHASERVMIPVRKPGRPLSSCACAPGRPCQCGGGLRVAIPKVQKCSCGTDSVEEEDEDEEKRSVSSSSANKMTPTPTSTSCRASSPAPSSYRVSKLSSSSRQGSRKQSLQTFDPVNLERVHADSVNIVSPYSHMGRGMMPPAGNSMPQPVPQPPPPGPGVPIGYVLSGPTNGFGHDPNVAYATASMTYTITAPRPPSTHIQYAHTFENKTELEKNSLRHVSATPAMSPGTIMTPAVNGSRRHSVQTVAAPPAQVPAKKSGGGSCCCGGGDKSEPPAAKPAIVAPASSYQYGVVPQFQQVQYPQQQSTTFTYPAQYGSWQNPINPVIWQQIATQQGQTVGERNGSETGTTHDCSCGPGCECVGCLAHPYNSGTFAYITDAYSEGHEYVNGHGDRNGTSHEQRNGTQNGEIRGRGVNGGGKGQGEAVPPSPPTAHTPSDASGANSEEQLSMNDYLFLDMPFDGNAFGSVEGSLSLCSGSVVLCTCGPDCQCEGCEIHNGGTGRQE